MPLIGGGFETVLGVFLMGMSFLSDEARPGLMPPRSVRPHRPQLWERAVIFVLGLFFACDGLRRLLH